MTEDYLIKVIKIAKFKYDLDEEILEAYNEEIELCWKNNFSPSRTVEFIADKIF